MSAGDAIAVVVVGAALVLGTLVVAGRIVGDVAREFGEDPARWRMLMLPFGLLGPLVARMLLTRRGGPPRYL